MLRLSGDELVRSTLRRTAVLLPFGAIAATGGGVGAAWLYDFTTRPYTVVVSSLVAAVILAGTFAAARVLAVRRAVANV